MLPELSTANFTAGENEVVGTCGSVTWNVIVGAIEAILVSPEGDTAEVSLDAGDEFFFDDETFTMESTAGTAEITVVADDGTTTEIPLTAGNTITVDPETSIITADPDNPTDVIIIIDGEETTVTPGGSAAPSPEQAIQNVIDELNSIVSENPGALADKAEDASASVQTVLDELNKTPSDNQAAAGNMEGAIGSLEDAIKDNGLDQTTGESLIDHLLTVSRQLATDAINIAIDTGGDAGKIYTALEKLDEGDNFRDEGKFKDAAAKYKDALSEAESALP